MRFVGFLIPGINALITEQKDYSASVFASTTKHNFEIQNFCRNVVSNVFVVEKLFRVSTFQHFEFFPNILKVNST